MTGDKRTENKFPHVDANWGQPPWQVSFAAQAQAIPSEVDYAVIGGGFSGLSAATWLKRYAPEKTVALFEAHTIGAGASGRNGGMVLAETAAGDLPGLGDVLAGFQEITRELGVNCELDLPGAYELARTKHLANSPISWSDSGRLGVSAELPGGTADPGLLLDGLARAAKNCGVQIFENAALDRISFDQPMHLEIASRELRAHNLILATNANALQLSGLERSAEPKFTLALATEQLGEAAIAQLGLESRRPFYTADFPYLWGRIFQASRLIFGSGLVHVDNWRDLFSIAVNDGEAGRLLRNLESRVRALHPVLKNLQITHRWGGPILIGDGMRPVLQMHSESANAIVLGAYSGHGVALSVYLGRWAAQAILNLKPLPSWQPASKQAQHI